MKSKHHVFTSCLFFLYTMLFPSQILAQTVTGQVVDSITQSPLQGANVVEHHHRTGSSTDIEGRFSLSLSDIPSSILVSYVGYESKRIDVSSTEDSLIIELQPMDATLQEITVTSFESDQRLIETPGSISMVSQEPVRNTDGIRIPDLLNRVPGVQADQSHTADTRISIRGAGFRAPFGVRNLRIYLNDIPITEADGFTRVEAIDLQNIGRAEVIRGPASSMYGAGLGGVIRFETAKSPAGTSVRARSGTGSYGLRTHTLSVSNRSEQSEIRVSGGSQTYDGYRAQSMDDRLFFTTTGSYYTDRSTFNYIASVSNQQSQIPGSLTEEEFDSNPRAAEPQAVALNTGRDQRWTRMGLSHDFHFNKAVEQQSSLFGSFYELDHPLAFAYLRNGQQNYGGRTVTTLSHDLAGFSLRHNIGVEAMYQFVVGRRYENVAGDPGGILSDLETSVVQWSAFAQTEANLTDRLRAVGGLSVNKFRYDILDLLKANGNDQTGIQSFDLSVSPRISLLYLLTDDWSVHGGVSYGFSPPTTNEISLPDGSINRSIDAEKGVNYEIGTRGQFMDRRVNLDLTLYRMSIRDELVPRSVGPGQTLYENAGKTSHKGVELALNAIVLHRYSGLVRQIRPAVTYTYSDHTFDTFVVNGTDVAGNHLSGISPHSLRTNVDISTVGGVFLIGDFSFMDRRPLTDENSVFNESYAVVNLRGGIERPVGDQWNIRTSLSVNNLFDERYSPRSSLNASSFGGGPPRYYNPAPGRNLLLSVELSWNQTGQNQ